MNETPPPLSAASAPPPLAQAPAPVPTPAKKSMAPLVLVAIGCGGLLLLALLAVALLAVFSVRQATKTLVNRDGTQATLETQGAGEKQEIRIKSPAGSMVTGADAANAKLPAWLPVWPDAKPETAFEGHEGGKRTGMIQFQTKTAPAEVLAFYETGLQKAGLTVQKALHEWEGVTGGSLEAKAAGRRAILAAVMAADKTTAVIVTVTFEEAEPVP